MARQMGHTASDRSTLSPSPESSFLTIADILTLVRGQWQRSHQHSTIHITCDQIVLDVLFTVLSFYYPCHKSGTAEGGEVARNQAPPHRLDWPINAMFILGIRKSKIKQNGYYLFFHFLLLNISHNAGKTLLLTHF